jgi:hypothetical protein
LNTYPSLQPSRSSAYISHIILITAGPDGQPLPSKYDLIANVVHEGKAGQQTGGAPYKAHIQRSVEKTWYEVQVRVDALCLGFDACICSAGKACAMGWAVGIHWAVKTA